MASSSVSTFISALSFQHKIKNIPDPTSNFLVKKCLQGYNNKMGKADSRLPITQHILKKLCKSLEFTASSAYVRTMIKSMFLLAFHCFLRIGEFTYSNLSSNNSHLLQTGAIHFLFNDSSKIPFAFEVHMESYKHSKGRSHNMCIQSNKTHCSICPVMSLWSYFQVRKPVSGPLFTFLDGTPVSRKYFTDQLKLSLVWCGLDPNKYKSHSFRIGAATTAFAMGISEQNIREMGRWSSDAMKKYIRVPMLTF